MVLFGKKIYSYLKSFIISSYGKMRIAFENDKNVIEVRLSSGVRVSFECKIFSNQSCILKSWSKFSS